MILQNNSLAKVMFVDSVDGENIASVMIAIDGVMKHIRESKEIRDVTLVINSPGGVVQHAIALCDYIDEINSDPNEPIKINTHGFGMVGSCAISILCAGRNIKLSKRCIVMHHMASILTPFQKLNVAEEDIKFALRTNESRTTDLFSRFNLNELEVREKERQGLDQNWYGYELTPLLKPQPEPNPVRPNPDWVDPHAPKLPKNGIVLNGELYETPLDEATFESTAARLEAIYKKSLTMVEKQSE